MKASEIIVKTQIKDKKNATEMIAYEGWVKIPRENPYLKIWGIRENPS